MSTLSTHRTLTAGLRGTVARDALLVLGSTAIIAASAQIAVRLPFSPVPITGQTLAVLLVGAALGANLALSSSMLYLALALAGLPVLAPNAEGLHTTGTAVLSMPSLGYVVGFIAASYLVGTMAERGFSRTPGRTVIAMLAGNLAIYAFGLLWLHHATDASWAQTIAWGLTPFLIGDAIKIALAAGLLPTAWRLTR